MNKIKYFLIAGVAALALSSCSSDFLDTKPTDSAGITTVFDNTDNAKYAVNGLARVMMNQYLSVQGMNGEGTVKVWFGNYPGADFYVNLPGWSTLINQNNHDTPTSQYTYYAWYYYYKIIGNANTIVCRIKDATGKQEERDFIKAQALTFRAYAFFMLTQFYCKRWVDSNNGDCPGLVLRLDESTGDYALTSLKDAYEQIYKDLDEAIELYQKSGMHRASNEFFLPDIEVAYAIYARAALTRHDWANASKYAKMARANYPLMSNKELLEGGFCDVNDEWIWGGYSATDQTLYYYSYHAYIAYNSNAGNVKNYPKCISKELFNQIPVTDVRRGWWLDPTGYSYTQSSGQAGTSTQLYKDCRAAHPDMNKDAKVYAYMQFKVKCVDTPGVGDLNFFRSSEMYLIEAEAEQMMGNDAAAQAALIALNKTSGRDPQYTCTKTGADLLNEIKLYRRIELWGEGFDWFDLKRWKDPMVRHNPSEGGNFLATLAVTVLPMEKNEWRFMIPNRETDYNKAVKDGVITPAGQGNLPE